MSRNGSIAMVVLMLTLCTAGAASARPLDPEMAETGGEVGFLGGLWDRLLDWLDRATGEGDGGFNTLEMDTCHLDPNGGGAGGGGSCGGGS